MGYPGRGRPQLEGELVEVFVHLRLRAGEDDDLITFFARMPPGCRSDMLKAALRAGGMSAPRGAADQVEAGALDIALDDFLF